MNIVNKERKLEVNKIRQDNHPNRKASVEYS